MNKVSKQKMLIEVSRELFAKHVCNITMNDIAKPHVKAGELCTPTSATKKIFSKL